MGGDDNSLFTVYKNVIKHRLLNYTFSVKGGIRQLGPKTSEDPLMHLFLSSSRGDSVGEALEHVNEIQRAPIIDRLYSYIKEAKERIDFMKVFMSGVLPYEKEANEKEIDNRLLSKHFIANNGQMSPQVLKEMKDNKGMIMVDSGAFTVWTKGKEIDIDEYSDWIKENIEYADYFVSLDVIPGSLSRPCTSYTEKQESAGKSLKNYFKMVRKGIPPEKLIHVLHFGDDMKWADRSQDMPFIGFGGLVGQNPAIRKEWLSSFTKKLIDKEGYPVNKWHVFGVTDQDILLSAPFYSADSAGWLRKAVTGSIDIWNGSKFLTTRICHEVKDGTNHFFNLPEKQKQKMKEIIESYGFTMEQIQEKNPVMRIGFNIVNWKAYEKYLDEKKPWPWNMPKTMPSLF